MTTNSIGQAITFITGSDMDRSRAFYHDTLGLQIVWQRPGVTIFEIAPNGYLGVIVAPGREPRPEGITIAMVTDDIQGLHDRLVAAGVTPKGPPQYAEAFDNTFFFIDDPDGHAVEMVAMHDKSWPMPLSK